MERTWLRRVPVSGAAQFCRTENKDEQVDEKDTESRRTDGGLRGDVERSTHAAPTLSAQGSLFRSQIYSHLAHDGILGTRRARARSARERADETEKAHLEVCQVDALLVVLLAKEQIPETLGLGLLLEVLHDGDDRLPTTLLSRLRQLSVVQVLGRQALLLDEGDQVVERLLGKGRELVLDLRARQGDRLR